MVAHQQRSVDFPTEEDFAVARTITRKWLSPTPMIAMTAGDQSMFLKLETLQPTGSFKVRGALTALSRVAPGKRAIAVSAGNHALAIAWAASHLRIPATLVLAHTASPAKLHALRRFPVELIVHGNSYDEAETHALELASGPYADAVFVSAYNDPGVIAGQSTMLDEIVKVEPDRELQIVVPTGGGGLLSGIAMRAATLSTRDRPIHVVGVEAAASPAVSTAVSRGDIVSVDVAETVADGLAGNLEPGSITVDIVRAYAPQMVTVNEEELHVAIRTLATDAGIVAEGAGAAATAALLAGKVATPAEAVSIAIVSGRNIALPRLAALLADS